MNFKRILVAILCLPAAVVGADRIQRLEPPSWWVGMAEPRLQLMVHGPGIGELMPRLDHPGVALERVQRTANPNYLFVDLRIAADAAAGTLDLVFEGKDGVRFRQPYVLAARAPGSAARQGFSPRDVIYLITPDRFANGDRDNDRVEGLAEGPDRTDPDGRHGGDLQGIIDHLDYVQSMGFTQIWLNPILENNQLDTSYHGYAITDLYRVDPRHGDNALYQTLSSQARQRGIGVIQDVIPNHIGSEHWWMADLPAPDWINHGGRFVGTNHMRESLHDPHAVEADLSAFQDGWFVPTMPDLNQRNPMLATYLTQNAIWWIEYAGLSGLRIDTYSYPDKAFLSDWTARIMAEYPNLNLVGEEWSLNPAIVAYWQRGARRHDDYRSSLPSLMDFPLQHALVRALTEPEAWNGGLRQLYWALAGDFHYADPYNLVVFGDNHDMSRIYTQLGEDPARYRMAMAYLATTRGIPQIFYGTEVLMKNPGTTAHGVIRSDFPGGWPGDPVDGFTGAGLDATERDAQAYLKSLLNWRRGAPAIHAGELIHYAPADGVYVYFRRHPDQTVMVALNKSDQPVRLPTARFAAQIGSHRRGIEVPGGRSHELGEAVTLPPMTALILELQ